VFAEKVLVQEFGLHRFAVRKKAQSFASKANEMFQDDGVVDGVINSLAPGKRTMARDENAGTMQWVAAIEGFNDDFAGVRFVIIFDLAGV
jgi:hypothetical protein